MTSKSFKLGSAHAEANTADFTQTYQGTVPTNSAEKPGCTPFSFKFLNLNGSGKLFEIKEIELKLNAV